MSTNAFQIATLNANLFYNDGGVGTWPPFSGQNATELPLIPDNLNRALANLTCPMGIWSPYTHQMQSSHQSEASRNGGSWWQPNGGMYSYASRAQGAFYSRVVAFTDEISRFGIVGGMVGGLVNPWYSLDGVNGGAVDYEPIYGHGVTSWPFNIDSQSTQYRNANSLPSDGASRINTTGSAWSRSNRLHSVHYIIHVLQGGTIASGNIQVVVEQRPTSALTHGTNSFPFNASNFNIPTMHTGIDQAQYEVLLSRVWGATATVSYQGANHNSNSDVLTTAYPPIRLNDPRIRGAATFNINYEYYGFVVDSWILVYSNKTSFCPVYVKDLSTIWPAATHPRIAGIASDPTTLNMWALSESGEVAFIDMSVEGGIITAKASANSLLNAGERFGGFVKVGSIIYAMIGSYGESLAMPPATQVVGIVAYDTVANSWSVRRDYTGQARFSGRSLREMAALSDGRLAMLVESVDTDVLVPATLKTYGPTWTTLVEVPADLQSVVVKLAGSDLVAPASTRFKLRYQLLQAHAIGATIKRVPAGSPVGTAFSDTATITHGTATAWDNDAVTTPRTTDWINMPLDPAYDYYVFFYAGIPNSSGLCYDGTTGPRFGLYGCPTAQTVGKSRTAFFSGDLRNSGTVPDLNFGINAGVWHGAVVDLINDSGTDTFPGVVNTGLPSASAAWQLLVYNPTTFVWNANTLDNANAMLCPLTSRQFGELFTPAANRLLIQASPFKDRIFAFDYSGVLDNTKFTALSWGAGGDIFPATWDKNYSNGALSTQELTITQNLMDSSVLFHLNGSTKNCSTGYEALMVGWAWPQFAWDGTEKIQQINPNTLDANNTRTATKDLLYACNLGVEGNMNKMVIPSFADTQITFVHPGYESSTGNILPGSATGGTYYLPRYFRFQGGNWVPAKNWADAAANPMSVSSTPDLPLNGPHGIVFLFGPNASTTFLAGEFHSMNVAYGYVKYARRGRYTFTVFAGRTFQMTETKTLAALRAIVPILHHPAGVSASGPSNLSVSGGHITWPTYNSVGDYINDNPCVVTYDFTLAAPGVSAVPRMSANTTGSFVASASSSYDTNHQPYMAFKRTHTTPVNDCDWWAASGTTPWLMIDMGAPITIRSYRLGVPNIPRTNYALGNMTGWTLQGSTNGTDFDDLHVVTGKDWGTGLPWVGATDFRGTSIPHLANVPTPGSYRYYRILWHLHNSGGSYVGVSLLDLFTADLATSVDFSDITAFNDGTGVAVGTTFEVNTGSGFNAITPRFRSHQGEIYSFDRQTGVQQLRITTKNGRHMNNSTRYWGPVQLWDYGTQAVVNAARLGSAAAVDGTAAKGSFDSQCIGVNGDGVAVSVDGISPQQYVPVRCSEWAYASRGWHFYGPEAVQSSNTYAVHPFFGFVWLAPNVTGTDVKIAYAWGRRV